MKMKGCRRFERFIISLVVLTLFLFPGISRAAIRLQPSDLVYQGAFLLPENDYFAGMGDQQNTYREATMSFHPSGNGGVGSLYVSYGTKVAEITIPTAKMSSLNIATVLNSTANIQAGSVTGQLQNDSGGGVAFVPARGAQTQDRLYWQSYEYYNTDFTDYNSLGMASTNLSNPSSIGLWHIGPHTSTGTDWNFAAKYGGYFVIAPQSWADMYTQGRSILVGRSREGGGAGGSMGPVLTAVAPVNDITPPAGTTELSAIELLGFDTATGAYNTNWQKWKAQGDPDWIYYNVKDWIRGGVWIDDGIKRAVVLVLKHGVFSNQNPCTDANGGFGYNGGFCARPQGDAIPYCYWDETHCSLANPSTSTEGFHSGPYYGRLQLIDISDLEAVARGTKTHDSINAYATYNLMNDWGKPSGTKTDRYGANDACGIAYDDVHRFLYVCQSNGNDPNGHPNPAWPVIHVYSISGTPDTTPPTSPTNLAANSTSQSSITVSWTAATDDVGVTGYQVERCTGLSCTTFANVGNPTASPFVDSGLTASTGYSYHVRALDAAGNMSGWSNVVGATTQAPDTTPPSTPTSLSATATSSSTIDLTWTASTDNVAVTGYKVERCSGASCTTFTQVGTPTTNSYQDTGLSASTTYRYQVRAVDGAGNNSSYSNIASATTPQAPPTPTFVAEYETAWNSATSPKTTSNFSVQTGDILVAYAVNESSGSTIATPPTGTLVGTWTLKQTISATNYTYLRLWTMQVASNQTNVNVSFSNGGGNFGADVLHFRNASSVGITAQANSATGNPTLTLNGISDNSSIVMVNGDWSAKTGARTYNTTSAGTFTETSAYADGSSYGVEAGYYGNAGTAGNKTIGITAPTGMTWALAAIEIKGSPTAQSQSCNTVTTGNFSQAAYNSYGAPFDAFQTSTNLLDAKCNSADTHTINLTTGVTGDTTRIVYTKGYYYDPVTAGWTQYSGTCTGALNGEWCQGSISATITNPNISTASSTNPTYLVGMTCSVQNGSWRCGCRDTTCANFYWQVQGAGM